MARHGRLAQLDKHQTSKPVMVSVSSIPTKDNFIFATSTVILYKNVRNLRSLLFTKTSNVLATEQEVCSLSVSSQFHDHKKLFFYRNRVKLHVHIKYILNVSKRFQEKYKNPFFESQHLDQIY